MYFVLRRLIIVLVALALPAALLEVWFDAGRVSAFWNSDDPYVFGFYVGCHGLVPVAVYTALERIAFTKPRRWAIYWVLVALWCGIMLAVPTEISPDVNYFIASVAVVTAVVAAIVCIVVRFPTQSSTLS